MSKKRDVPDGIEILALAQLGRWGLLEGGKYDFTRLPELVKASDLELIDYEAMRQLAMSALRDRAELPSLLAFWIADVLDGNRKPPARRGTHPLANWYRDWQICEDVQKLVEEEGMMATRNPASPPSSACDRIAAERGMTYQAVAKIWTNNKHLLS